MGGAGRVVVGVVGVAVVVGACRACCIVTAAGMPL